MDDFEKLLREDAARIRAPVSPALENRIRASLAAVADEVARPKKRATSRVPMWLASGLTGLAMAFALLALVNLWPDGQVTRPPASSTTVQAHAPLQTPLLHAERAVFTQPLEEELDRLESDLKKARETVEQDIGISF